MSAKLPQGWEERTDPRSTRKYYVHHATKTTQWNRPEPPAPPTPSAPPPPAPRALFHQDGVSVHEATAAAVIGETHRVFVITLDRRENWFNPQQVSLLSAALDVVENHPADEKALVFTSKGKFFSNGLDVPWMSQQPMHEVNGMIESVWRLLARVLVLGFPTVSAINGHAFGAGAFLSLATDFRVMQSSKGFVCFPEANLGMRLSKAFAELSKAKLGAKALRVGFLTAKRFDSAAALEHGLVDELCDPSELVQTAVAMASSLMPSALKFQNYNSEAYSMMKKELYTDAYRALVIGVASSLPESRL